MEHIIVIGIGGMLLFALGVIVFVLIHQRRVIAYQMHLRRLREEQQKLLLEATITSGEKERRRIAGELHDEVGASLSAIRLYLGQLTPTSPAAGTAREALDEVIAKVRRISHRLSPDMLSTFGLVEALGHTIQQLSDSGAIRASFHSPGTMERLDAERELAVYRIVQELIGNILKHAEATQIRLEMRQRSASILLTVEDDGKGFPQGSFEKLKSTPGGLGLKNIQSRMDILRANITFISPRPGGTGTLATLEVPAG